MKFNLASLARAILMVAGTYVTTTGVMDAGVFDQLVGAGMTIGGLIWGQKSATQKAKLVEKAGGV